MASSDSRGRIWLSALAGPGTAVEGTSTVLAADAPLGGEAARFIAVVPDPANRFPRARHGEVGLEEGWGLARAVRDAIEADRDGTGARSSRSSTSTARPMGGSEEMLGIHLACAAAADAYAAARLAGHPVVALIVGKAMSGAFLAHGYQANRILALADAGVLVHAMGNEAAARVTRRTVEELDRLGEKVPPMAYGIRSLRQARPAARADRGRVGRMRRARRMSIGCGASWRRRWPTSAPPATTTCPLA